MRLIIFTDIEGTAGVLNKPDWCISEGRYYEKGKELLTKEVNAAVSSFYENGFQDILVIDGHGVGGIDLTLLDERVLYQRGFVGPYPVGIEAGYDAIAWVGQHAKAGTAYAHICHTNSFNVIDQRVNGISLGEFGMEAYMAAEVGNIPIYASGDQALCREAEELCPHIVTTAVKRGLMPGEGRECTLSEYIERNTPAIHLTPAAAREKIHHDAGAAVKNYLSHKENMKLTPLKAPYELEMEYRTECHGQSVLKRYFDSDSLVAVFNKYWADQG